MQKLLGFLVSFLIVYSSFGQNEKAVESTKIEDEIKIDGILDEAAWKKAKTTTSFIQNSPNPGKKASKTTDVSILYDNSAIYISAVLHDASRDSILRQLTQRDNGIRSDNCDYFGVHLDTYNDDQNAFSFYVTAAGVQIDERNSVFDDDVAWNAVWTSSVRLYDDKWVVEIKIPFSALRFSTQEIQEWGINFSRRIRRKRETSYWSNIDPNVDGFANQFGLLKGLNNIEAPVRLFFFPYVSGYQEHYPFDVPGKSNWSSSVNGGMDLKYGINDAFTLDMTLIPDFGQVQSDNQVLNLSPFEVQFNENRQFFTEGTELFNKADLFYSRRIGGRPVNFESVYNELQAGEEVIANPTESKLINATKVSGRNGKGLGIGFFNGVTNKTEAIIQDSSGNQTTFETDPLTNYNVLVLDQNLKNNSYVSLTNTNVTRNGEVYDANVTGLQSRIADKNNKYSVFASGKISNKYGGDFLQNNLGFKTWLSFAKQSGKFQFGTDYVVTSDKFDINDLGFQFLNNEEFYGVYGSYNLFEPKGKFIRRRFGSSIGYSRLYNPDDFTGFEINAFTNATLRNFLTYGVEGKIVPLGERDYYEPRTADFSQFYALPAWGEAFGFFSSDYSKTFALDGNFGAAISEQNGRYVTFWRLNPRYRISDKVMFTYVLSNRQAYDDVGYVNNIGNDIYLGKRNLSTITNVLNLNYIHNNKMGVTFRLRHYWARAEYNAYYLLGSKGELISNGYTGLDANNVSLHNNNFNAFNIDMVYRWVFSPGSEMSIVWKNSLLSSSTDLPTSFREDLTQTFEQNNTNSISIKVLYFIDYLSLKRKP